MKSYFDLLDIEETYQIDRDLLDERYFTSQAKYHPDKAKTTQEKSYFTQISGMLNTAYEYLKDDFLRASHLLELHGINISSDKDAPKVPLEILEEILEMQEALEAHRQAEEISRIAKAKSEKIITELSFLFSCKDYAKAAVKAMQLKYLKNILEKV